MMTSCKVTLLDSEPVLKPQDIYSAFDAPFFVPYSCSNRSLKGGDSASGRMAISGLGLTDEDLLSAASYLVQVRVDEWTNWF